MTLIQQDLSVIAEIVRSVTGFGLEAFSEDARTTSDVMPAKVALCYYMNKMKYSKVQIACALHCSRSSLYHYFRCHENMMFSDPYYKRCIAAINEKLNNTNTDHEENETDNQMDSRRRKVLHEYL